MTGSTATGATPPGPERRSPVRRSLEPLGLERRWEERVQRAAHPLVYPLLSRARRPVLRVPGVGVLVTDAEVLRSVLLRPAAFTKTGPGSPSDLWTPVLGPSVLLNMEGADHLALRRRLSPLFSPAVVSELTRSTLSVEADRMRRALAAGEPVDLVATVREFAGRMISGLVGLDREVVGEELFARVSRITGYVRLSRPRLTDAQVASARAVLDELTRGARGAYHAEADTVPARMRELGLSEEEAMGAVGAFVLTGTETLVSYLPRLIAVLADTGWLSRLAADRTLVAAAVAEGLRVTTPSPVMLRSVVAEADVGGVVVRPGERLVLATFLANRASGAFDPVGNPSADLKQLWFGAGAHFCLGAPLAMAQISLVLDAVLDAELESGGAGRPLRLLRRSAQRGVLIPGYRRLVLGAG
ncbi:cytochrome P450 [Herbiconiux moechotypicola]|uniref:Cytochrome P450 n=1 Tax=Herbiconiux moechotypicola TaxID=637393 RepID=A0ABN3DNA5_9MICO|nr:cytochrome P450 [Herbiconiux moechotypicola]MCS5730368.1 cytochrome P450 [Herbiconiux moechotypicola]